MNRSTNGCPMAMQSSVKKEKLDVVQMCYSKGYSGKCTLLPPKIRGTDTSACISYKYSSKYTIGKNRKFFKFPVEIESGFSTFDAESFFRYF